MGESLERIILDIVFSRSAYEAKCITRSANSANFRSPTSYVLTSYELYVATKESSFDAGFCFVIVENGGSSLQSQNTLGPSV